MLGLALYQLERFSEALTEMQAYRRMSGRADQNHIIADCLRALGRPDRAVPLAEEALAPEGVPLAAKAEAVIVAASALADQGKFDQALGMLRRIRTRDDVAGPEVIRVWYVTGRHPRAGRAAGRRRSASSARSCATTRARSTPPSAPLSSPDRSRADRRRSRTARQ